MANGSNRPTCTVQTISSPHHRPARLPVRAGRHVTANVSAGVRPRRTRNGVEQQIKSRSGWRGTRPPRARVRWFTEGFDTPDQIEAKSLLKELAQVGHAA